MAKIDIDTEANRAQVLEDDRDELVAAGIDPDAKPDPNAGLVAWVVAKTDEWRQHRKTNYEASWDKYERLWRGIWSGSEKERQSERSKIVNPALSEAVENGVAEIEEAVFGRGDFFDLRPESKDNETEVRALASNKKALREDLSRSSFVLNVSDALLNGGIYGLGVGEIVVEDDVDREIVPQMGEDGSIEAGVVEKEVTRAHLRSANPRNFLWDPAARDVDDGLGIAFEDNVGLHLIRKGQEDGAYLQCDVRPAQPEPQLGADPQVEGELQSDTAHVLRYYGLVPKHLLFPPEQVEDLGMGGDEDDEETGGEMVEAIVVIANKAQLLKAVENPSLMKDRPAVIFKWDSVPGRLPGRGVCEKGEVPQRLLDAELRSRMDALAFTAAPMMGMDATRLPRGFKFEVKPGRSILTAGDPSTVLRPFTFGQIDQNTWQQAQALDQMVQRATGSLNMTQMAQSAAGGDARSGAVSMSLAGVVKRSKRTLLHFIEGFFIPSLEKILWRNMQYNPQRYIPLNSSFVATSTMGIMQREYELMSLTQLLATMQPQSREYKTVLMGVIANTGLHNRDRLISMLQQAVAQETKAAEAAAAQAGGVDPQMAMLQQQLQQVQIQLEIAERQAKIRKLNAEAGLAEAKTQTEMIEPEIQAREVMMKGIYEVPQAQQSNEFDRRMKLAEQILDAQDIESNERIARIQAAASVQREKVRGAANVAAARTKSQGDVVAGVAEAAVAAQTSEPQPQVAVLPTPAVVATPDSRMI